MINPTCRPNSATTRTLLAGAILIGACFSACGSSGLPTSNVSHLAFFIAQLTVSDPQEPIISQDAESITPVDITTGQQGTTLKVARGTRVATPATLISPDGKTAYVAVENSDPSNIVSMGELLPVDLSSGKELTPIADGFDPGPPLFTNHGKLILIPETYKHLPRLVCPSSRPLQPSPSFPVCQDQGDSAGDSVLVVSTETNRAVNTIHVCASPRSLQPAPGGQMVWVFCGQPSHPGSIQPIDLTTLTAGNVTAVSDTELPYRLSFAPSGSTAYIETAHQVSISSSDGSPSGTHTTTGYSLTPIDLASGKLAGPETSFPPGAMISSMLAAPMTTGNLHLLAVLQSTPLTSSPPTSTGASPHPAPIVASIVSIDPAAGTYAAITNAPEITQGSSSSTNWGPVLAIQHGHVVVYSLDASSHRVVESDLGSGTTPRAVPKLGEVDSIVPSSSGQLFFVSKDHSELTPMSIESGVVGTPFPVQSVPAFIVQPSS